MASGYMSHCSSMSELIYVAKLKLASIMQIDHRSCGNNRFWERSPGLKVNFKIVEKSAFLGSLMYALVREVCRS